MRYIKHNKESQEESHLFLRQCWREDDALAKQSGGAQQGSIQPSEEGYMGDILHDKLAETSDSVLVPIPNFWMKPYKVVEMFENYRPNFPGWVVCWAECQGVGESEDEKNWSIRVSGKLKATKYSNDKEQIESKALDNGEGKA